MALPFEIWFVLLVLAVVCTGYLFFVNDRNNYSEAMAGILAFIFWVISGMSFFVGLITQDGTVTYQSTSIGWIFTAIGLVIALITFVKILDIVAARKKEKNNQTNNQTNMSPIRL